MKTRFIVNPRAANGLTGKKWPGILELLKSAYPFPFDSVLTEYPMHAVQLSREGIEAGCERIIAVGGDGTINEVLNGFIQNDRLLRDDAALGVLEIGTGADFQRTLHLPADPRKAVEGLGAAQPRKIDIGKAEYIALSGKRTTRYFINILDFGIGGAVVERVNRTSKRFGGRISFLWAILITLFSYRNKNIRFRCDGGDWESRTLNNFIAANGRFFGGGLMPAPDASLTDGVFDIVLFGNLGRREAIANLSRLRAGTHLDNPHVSVTRKSRAEAVSGEEVFIDMDGEFVGKLPVKVEILPAFLPLLM